MKIRFSAGIFILFGIFGLLQILEASQGYRLNLNFNIASNIPRNTETTPSQAVCVESQNPRVSLEESAYTLGWPLNETPGVEFTDTEEDQAHIDKMEKYNHQQSSIDLAVDPSFYLSENLADSHNPSLNSFIGFQMVYLKRFANECYLNAVMYILYQYTSMTFFLNKSYNFKEEYLVTRKIKKIIKRMSHSSKPITLMDLYLELSMLMDKDTIDPSKPMCVDEVYRSLISKMYSELKDNPYLSDVFESIFINRTEEAKKNPLESRIIYEAFKSYDSTSDKIDLSTLVGEYKTTQKLVVININRYTVRTNTNRTYALQIPREVVMGNKRYNVVLVCLWEELKDDYNNVSINQGHYTICQFENSRWWKLENDTKINVIESELEEKSIMAILESETYM